MKASIKLKISILVVALLLASNCIIGIGMYLFSYNNMLDSVHEHMSDISVNCANQIRNNLFGAVASGQLDINSLYNILNQLNGRASY